MGGTLFSFASLVKYLPIIALVVFGGISPMVLTVAPALELHLVAEMGLDYATTGGYFWGEMAAFGCGVVLAYGWCGRFDPRQVAFLALLAFVLGNLINALWMPNLMYFVILRGISGIGAGTLTVISVLAAATSPNRDRVFGVWLVGQLLIGTLVLMILPYLFEFAGLRGLYMLLVLLGGLSMPLAQFIEVSPRSGKTHDVERRKSWRNLFAPVPELVGLLSFYIAIGSVWTFVGEAGAIAGIREDSGSIILSVATALGVAGALSASAIAGQMPRAEILLLGYLLVIVPIGWLTTLPGSIGYAVSVVSFKFAWTFTLPFILASLMNSERQASFIVTVCLVITSGISLGALLAGQFLQAGLQLYMIFAIGFVVMVLSAVLMVRAEMMRHNGSSE